VIGARGGEVTTNLDTALVCVCGGGGWMRQLQALNLEFVGGGGGGK